MSADVVAYIGQIMGKLANGYDEWQTRNILYVKKILGRKRIQNTLKYIDLEATIFTTVDDQWTVSVATD